MKVSTKSTTLFLAAALLLQASFVAAAELSLGSFRQPTAHGLSGEVFALSDTVLEVRNFQYDGLGPDAYFWADTGAPTSNGYRLPDEVGCAQETLTEGTGQTIQFEFPEGMTIKDFAGGTISVWCELANQNFGDVLVPDMATLESLKVFANGEGPAVQCRQSSSSNSVEEVVIGTFENTSHDLSGQVVALSDSVLEVRNFRYDGLGPDAYFWADTGRPSSGGFRLLDETNCARDELGEGTGQTIRFEFPEGQTLKDIVGGSISVWCEDFNENFGDVTVPDMTTLNTLRVAADGAGPDFACRDNVSALAKTPEGYSCESLNDDYQVRWKVEGNQINFELLGRIDEGVYMGFGVSGDPNKAEMIGADPVIADFFENEYRARDYYLSSRSQCSGNDGACPDNGPYEDDVLASSVSGEQDGALTLIRYSRPLVPTDQGTEFNSATVDRSIDASPGAMTTVIWALGPVDSVSGNPFFHNIGASRSLIRFELGREPLDNCEILGAEEEEEEEIIPFFRPVITDTTDLRAVIGPSGGDRGYLAIAQSSAWGIAWYINDLLVPVIEMRRGTTYTFSVSGGDDPSSSAEYHPFYLTDSLIGGYKTLEPSERAQETIIAGIDITNSTNDEVLEFDPEIVAPICQYKATSESSGATEEGFPYYFTTLDTSCKEDDAITNAAATLTFTPDENTPDTLYYQCVTHTHLGWEIAVIDEGAPSILEVDCSNFGSTPVRISNELTMNALVDPVDNTVEIELIYEGIGWVGVAFTNGSPSMVGAEAVIGLPDEPNSPTNPAKYNLNRREPSGVVQMPAEQQTLMNANITQTESQTILKFKKLMIEPDEHPLFTDTENTLLFAYGSSNSLGFHARSGNLQLRMNQCAVRVRGELVNDYALDWQGDVGIDETDLNRSLWVAHGACASIAWAILVPLAVGASLIRKVLVKIGLPEGAWFQIHRALNTLAAILTLIAFALAVHAINEGTASGESADHFSLTAHHKAGLVIFILTMSQAINGILRPHLPATPAKEIEEAPATSEEVEQATKDESSVKHSDGGEKSTGRKVWEISHRLLGVTLLGLCWWQVQEGFSLFATRFDESNLDYVFWIVVCSISGSIICLAVYQRVAL